MPPAMNAALSALSAGAERLGLGADLRDAPGRGHHRGGRARHLLGTAYAQPTWTRPACPRPPRPRAKSGVVAGVQVARELGSAALLDSARARSSHGMDTMLWVCGGIALASAILALVFLPRRPDGTTGAPPDGAASPAAGESGPERAESEV